MQKLHLGAAQCALDLGDGSERAEYVNQDYILHKLGRPHRAIGIMYTYYLHDKQWPQRISKACKDMNITFSGTIPMMIISPSMPTVSRGNRCGIFAATGKMLPSR